MASELVKYVSDGSWEQEVVKSDVPVLVDFTATWCGPCKALAPIIDQIANEYGGRLKVVKLDIDDSPVTPTRFNIRGVPTVILVKNGQEVARNVGLAQKARLESIFAHHIAS
ncbi:MAG: thioredoxin [Myxococcales bacterium]|nr:thioredoxin [Myxococcales bacterium]